MEKLNQLSMVQNQSHQIGRKKASQLKQSKKKSKFDWIKKLDIFKKSDSKKEQNKNK
jgi:membrane fusion protein (multidrug efflux system)